MQAVHKNVQFCQTSIEAVQDVHDGATVMFGGNE